MRFQLSFKRKSVRGRQHGLTDGLHSMPIQSDANNGQTLGPFRRIRRYTASREQRRNRPLRPTRWGDNSSAGLRVLLMLLMLLMVAKRLKAKAGTFALCGLGDPLPSRYKGS
ncbi:hypothetical protein U5801_08415 [Lamprobacter modestohalophilus]|uniref:hypothetical protein n=1 Tax=Lamprobacter modestohalophilus TaxID=1064514 RepID=UPI002ADEEB6E|nr:hypothetical protein [Lamprobacter modestohalophilus]MEA1049830.1 hypothetical protein [Lamprobacter modestohalophilus]